MRATCPYKGCKWEHRAWFERAVELPAKVTWRFVRVHRGTSPNGPDLADPSEGAAYDQPPRPGAHRG